MIDSHSKTSIAGSLFRAYCQVVSLVKASTEAASCTVRCGVVWLLLKELHMQDCILTHGHHSIQSYRNGIL